LEQAGTAILGLSALILSVVNGVILVWRFKRDKANISVELVHPEVYQWFFKLPSSVFEGHPTREYGFLAYISIKNSGLRDVSINSWHLQLETSYERSKRYASPYSRFVELPPMSIVEPIINLGSSGHKKALAVLGCVGIYHDGNTMVKSGASIAGMAYYTAKFYGDSVFNPLFVGGKTRGIIEVKSVFGQKTTVKIEFTEISLEKAKSMIENIDQIDREIA
jgi:hypothetical protein